MSLLKHVFRTTLHALHAEDTLCSVFPFSGIIGHVHIHGEDSLALSAVNALFFIAGYAQQRKVTHRFQKNRDRADIFTEDTVVFESIGENNADCVVQLPTINACEQIVPKSFDLHILPF